MLEHADAIDGIVDVSTGAACQLGTPCRPREGRAALYGCLAQGELLRAAVRASMQPDLTKEGQLVQWSEWGTRVLT